MGKGDDNDDMVQSSAKKAFQFGAALSFAGVVTSVFLLMIRRRSRYVDGRIASLGLMLCGIGFIVCLIGALTSKNEPRGEPKPPEDDKPVDDRIKLLGCALAFLVIAVVSFVLSKLGTIGIGTILTVCMGAVCSIGFVVCLHLLLTYKKPPPTPPTTKP